MNDKEPTAAQPRPGKLAFYVALEAFFVTRLLFSADSALEYVAGGAVSVIGLFAIADWFKERRDYARRG